MNGVWLEIVAWTALLAGMFLGLAGVLLPGLPGPALIALGALAHKLLLAPWLSWWNIALLIFLSLIAWGLDIIGTLVGAKWMGATKWGLFGAAVGGIVGLFFGIIGLIVGPVIGAFAAEWAVARRHPRDSLRSGVGAGVGIGLSTLARLAVAIFMVMLVAFDLLFV